MERQFLFAFNQSSCKKSCLPFYTSYVPVRDLGASIYSNAFGIFLVLALLDFPSYHWNGHFHREALSNRNIPLCRYISISKGFCLVNSACLQAKSGYGAAIVHLAWGGSCYSTLTIRTMHHHFTTSHPAVRPSNWCVWHLFFSGKCLKYCDTKSCGYWSQYSQ